jgi:hypothetical protein
MPYSTTHLCESCRRRTELFYCRTTDEYLCEDCIMDLAKSYYDDDAPSTAPAEPQ